MNIAKSVVLDRKTGVLTIDGVALGYYLADEPVEVTADAVSVVRVPILAGHVEILGVD